MPVFFIILLAVIVLMLLPRIMRGLRLGKVAKKFGLSFTKKKGPGASEVSGSYPKYNVIEGAVNGQNVEIYDTYIQKSGGHESKSYTKIIIGVSETRLEHKKGAAAVSEIEKILERISR